MQVAAGPSLGEGDAAAEARPIEAGRAGQPEQQIDPARDRDQIPTVRAEAQPEPRQRLVQVGRPVQHGVDEIAGSRLDARFGDVQLGAELFAPGGEDVMAIDRRGRSHGGCSLVLVYERDAASDR
jgi:hypothetical protein